MPLQGQWERQNSSLRQLSGRERILAIVAAAATAVALLVFIVAAVAGSSSEQRPGCISAVLPSVVGGQRVESCGERAKGACARAATQTDPGSREIQKSCRRAGYL